MMTCEEVRMSLGVHALGALEPEEAVAVEAHLAGCDGCRREFEELSGVSVFLGRVSEHDVRQAASPPAAVLDRLLSARVKRRRRSRVLLAAAAAAVVVAGGGVAVSQFGQGAVVPSAARQESPASRADQPLGARDEPAAQSRAAQKASPSATGSPDPAIAMERAPDSVGDGEAGKVSGKVELYAGDTGSTVKVWLTGIPPGSECSLIAVGRDGTRNTAGSWHVPKAYRTAYGHIGSTSFSPRQIDRFEVVTAKEKVLLTIPVKR